MISNDLIVYVERDALKYIRNIIEQLRPNKAIIVSDSIVKKFYGSNLEEHIDIPIAWHITDLPTISLDEVIIPNTNDLDLVIGFGGGKSIDQAKIISKKAHIPWVSIPTAASHDGIASNVASINHNGVRYSEPCTEPKAVIADLSIIEKAPNILRTAGLGDILSKLSSLPEWVLGAKYNNEPFDKSIYNLVKSALESVLKNNTLENLIYAEIKSGIAMSKFGSSRPCSGTEHAISHVMDTIKPHLHGHQVAFATQITLYFMRKSGLDVYDPIDLKNILLKNNMPSKINDLEFTPKQLFDIIKRSIELMKKRNRYSIFMHNKISYEDFENSIKELNL